MRRAHSRVRLLLLCLAVPALAACGGGGNGSVDPGTNPPGNGGAPLVSMAGIDCG